MCMVALCYGHACLSLKGFRNLDEKSSGWNYFGLLDINPDLVYKCNIWRRGWDLSHSIYQFKVI